MSDNRQVATQEPRRGFPVYVENPSVEGIKLQQREKPYRVIRGNQMMLRDEATGEVVGEGVVAFMKREVVDTEKFVKMYLAQIDVMFDLTKAGQTAFKLLWQQVRENPNTDRVALNSRSVAAEGGHIHERTLQRGIRELLQKEFIFMSPIDGVYFFNVRLIFNGDRVITAKEYILKGSEAAVKFEQPFLALEGGS